jgi:transposase-like protein
VSRICAGLDEQVDAFRNRPLEGRYPYLWLESAASPACNWSFPTRTTD